jgi:hypothetical protein
VDPEGIFILHYAPQTCMFVILFVSTILSYLYIFRYLDVNEIQTIHADRLSHLKSLTRLWVLFSSPITIRFLKLRQILVQKIQCLNSKDLPSGLHSIISQNIEVFIITSVGTWNTMYICSLNRFAWNSILICDWSHVILYCPNWQSNFLVIHVYSVRYYYYL